MKDLLSKKTRNEFREYFVGTTLRIIADEFDAADVPYDEDYQPNVSGQRRFLVEQYYHAVDFSSWRDVQKILRVYEGVLSELQERAQSPGGGWDGDSCKREFAKLTRCLVRDGFEYSDGRIVAKAQNLGVRELAETASGLDSKILRRQIERIRNAIDEDPDLAIGTAKELVETTCNTILADFGVSSKQDWDLTRLVKETRGVLNLVPEDIPDSAKGADSIKRILGNLGQISQGIAELRNLYGTGHGKDGKFKGVGPRHARLAVGCATTLATFLFETHDARREKSI